MTAVLKTEDGITHGVPEHPRFQSRSLMETTCGLAFASWTYKGRRQGRRNRRKSTTQIPEALMGDIDCMSCLVKGTRP